MASKTETKRRAVILAFILASAFCVAAPAADERGADQAPAHLARKVAAQETAASGARDHYTYRQTAEVDEMDSRGAMGGEYREVRDIIFSPEQARSEQVIGKPLNTLHRLILTPEDFRDIREIQPFLLTTDQLFLYDTKFQGEEKIGGIDYWVLHIAPRQILSGQRLFEGLLWIDKTDYSIVRSEGRAVPQIRTMKSENLFPVFTTIREKVDGQHWFPVETYADDTLPFRNGPQRIRLIIRYDNYKRFGADSTITFKPKP
ncbi:MAG: hypothetical protein ABI165_16370 [Bryobacteraceae bacterium]